MLTYTKLKEKLGKLKTDDRGIKGVGKMVREQRTQDCDPSAKVTVEGEDCDCKVENRLELPVMLSVAPESMTYSEDEEETRHVFSNSCNRSIWRLQ